MSVINTPEYQLNKLKEFSIKVLNFAFPDKDSAVTIPKEDVALTCKNVFGRIPKDATALELTPYDFNVLTRYFWESYMIYTTYWRHGFDPIQGYSGTAYLASAFETLFIIEENPPTPETTFKYGGFEYLMYYQAWHKAFRFGNSPFFSAINTFALGNDFLEGNALLLTRSASSTTSASTTVTKSMSENLPYYDLHYLDTRLGKEFLFLKEQISRITG